MLIRLNDGVATILLEQSMQLIDAVHHCSSKGTIGHQTVQKIPKIHLKTHFVYVLNAHEIRSTENMPLHNDASRN